jgi:hypothetical protein
MKPYFVKKEVLTMAVMGFLLVLVGCALIFKGGSK